MDDKKFNFQFRARKINLILHFLKYTLKREYFKIIWLNKINIIFIITTNKPLILLTLVYYKYMKDIPC